MLLKRVLLLATVLLLLCLCGLEGKRSRGGSRSSSRGHYYTRKHNPATHVDPVSLTYGHNKKQEKAAPKPPDQPKPSAPVEPKVVSKEHVPVQQSAPKPVGEQVGKQHVEPQQGSPGNQRPIGWNVDQNQKEGG